MSNVTINSNTVYSSPDAMTRAPDTTGDHTASIPSPIDDAVTAVSNHLAAIDDTNGSNILTGGVGEDSFTFDTEPSSANVVVITDFDTTNDTIRLDSSIFTTLTKSGTLSSSFFRVGEKALDPKDHIVYDANTGVLAYDADGSGAGAAVKFAVIENKAALTAADFVVI
jgi:Ca2+-binding RTX toxin-like protein